MYHHLLHARGPKLLYSPLVASQQRPYTGISPVDILVLRETGSPLRCILVCLYSQSQASVFADSSFTIGKLSGNMPPSQLCITPAVFTLYHCTGRECRLLNTGMLHARSPELLYSPLVASQRATCTGISSQLLHRLCRYCIPVRRQTGSAARCILRSRS